MDLADTMKNCIKSLARAASETLFIWFFSSLLPILAIWGIGAITNNQGYQGWGGFSQAWTAFFNPAEIFIYTTTILSPSFAFMIFHWRARRNVGFYNAFFIAIMLLFMVSGFLYALQKAGNENLNGTLIYSGAIIIYCLSLAVWFLVKVYEDLIGKLGPQHPQESGSTILGKI